MTLHNIVLYYILPYSFSMILASGTVFFGLNNIVPNILNLLWSIYTALSSALNGLSMRYPPVLSTSFNISLLITPSVYNN